MPRPAKHKPEQILAAAVSAFSDEGVNVSTARIASSEAVSNGTLSNYFPTKQALIDSLYISIKSEMSDAQMAGNEKLAGALALLEEARTCGILVDLPLDYLETTIEYQIDHAVYPELDDHKAGVAFDALWNGITKTENLL